MREKQARRQLKKLHRAVPEQGSGTHAARRRSVPKGDREIVRMANAAAEARRIMEEANKLEHVRAQEVATKRRLEEIQAETPQEISTAAN